MFDFHSLICGVSNSVYSTNLHFGVTRSKEIEEAYQNNHRVKVEREETKNFTLYRKIEDSQQIRSESKNIKKYNYHT